MSVEMAEENLRKWNIFQATMVSNNDKLNAVLNQGSELVERGVFPVEKIQTKCDQIKQK